jgi:penicillin G amidase
MASMPSLRTARRRSRPSSRCWASTRATRPLQGRYWEPEDSAGWSLMMALDLGGNWGNELARLSALQVLDTGAVAAVPALSRVNSPGRERRSGHALPELGVFR